LLLTEKNINPSAPSLILLHHKFSRRIFATSA
jgi:hypothetical protein